MQAALLDGHAGKRLVALRAYIDEHAMRDIGEQFAIARGRWLLFRQQCRLRFVDQLIACVP